MNEKLVEFFNKQVDMEIRNAEGLRDAEAQIKNVLVRELFESIANDSIKHASIFKALTKIPTVTIAMTEKEFEMLRKVVIKHIKIEEEMINNIRNILKKDVDKRIEYLLKYILNDEYRHHALLSGILEAIVRREVIPKERWWDVIWKSTFSREAPTY